MSHTKRKRRTIARRGALSALEVFVALSILSAGLTLSAQLVVQHHRVLIEQRQYRLALDELSNQIEQLTALPADELPDALADLQPSDLTKRHLSSVALKGELAPADIGQQLTLSITWLEREAAPPLTLSAWIYTGEEPSP